MNSKASTLLCLALFLLLSSASSAFNITKLLGRHSALSTFNDFLTETQLAEQINSRNTITVLVVDNKDLAGVSGIPLDTIKKILSLHVILDYYDIEKLTELPNKTALVPTLFQASGLAIGQQGFLNVSLINEGEIAFGSAVKGSSLNSKLVESVAAQPYNISVLQITSPIVPPGIDQSAASPTNSPPEAAIPVAAPKKSPVTAPAHAPAEKPVPETPAPRGAGAPTVSPVPLLAPEADAPEADAPEANAPEAACTRS
ncbi:Fasciclin-like arabinogalactan protein 14 [Morella rubra]|uniref:Fasciclin-like arabinogalactan protein 14 n=1 Tax=Morella rubra TaxID=262757 RepID=A0A6A1UW37_9ROSI|nr:Fasciclin-like arabinogalactan protein 14 [Morella rubra]